MTRNLIIGALLGLGIAAGAGCGAACDSLEESLCEDLGEEGCKVWREHDRPGFPSGRRMTRQCVNAQMGPQYDATLNAAKASVAAYQKAGLAQ